MVSIVHVYPKRGKREYSGNKKNLTDLPTANRQSLIGCRSADL
jgi:hypothetical protein